MQTKVHLVRLWFFQWSCMDVRVGLWRKLSAKELMLLNVVLEKTFESPLNCKEIQLVHPKGISPEYSLEGLMLKLKLQLWLPDAKSWLIWKDPDAGKDWRREEKGMTEDEMVGWHHRHNEHEFYLNSKSWRWTGRPGVLQSIGSQKVRHDWATELKSHRGAVNLNELCLKT